MFYYVKQPQINGELADDQIEEVKIDFGNKMSHSEIFGTIKDSIKKPINYSNYTYTNHNMLSNIPVEMDKTYNDFLKKKKSHIIDYKTFF